MKKTSFLRVFAFLGIISLVVWGCGGWFGAKRQDKQQERAKAAAAADSTAHLAKTDTTTVKVDSAWLNAILITPQLKNDNPLLKSITDYVGTDGSIRHFKQDPPISAEDLLGKYKTALGLGPDDELRLRRDIRAIPNGYYADYQQYYKGLPVDYAYYNLTVKNGKILSANGSLIPGLDLEIPVRLSQAEAIERAIEYGHKKGIAFRWENAIEEAAIKEVTGDPNATKYPKWSSLQIWAAPPPDVHLSHVIYFIHLDAISPSAVFNVYVDANSGEVLLFKNNAVHACSPGLVDTEYGGYVGTTSKTYGQKSFKTVLNTTLNAYTLYTDPSDATCYGHQIRTHMDADSVSSANDIQNTPANSNDWLSGTTTNELATVHWAAQQCYDYYKTEHNVSAYNSGSTSSQPIEIWLGVERVGVSAPVAVTSSNFGGSPPRAKIQIAVGGVGSVFSNTCAWNDLYSLDLIGHEYTHVIDLVGDKLAWWQPPTPNPEALVRSIRLLESFCDVFGMVIENSAAGSNDWLILNDVTNCDKAIRSAQNPSSYGYYRDDSGGYIQGQASFYAQKSAYYYDRIYVRPSDEDEYSNTSILAHWFYYIVNGTGSSGPVSGFYTVSPLAPNPSAAMDKAAAIAYDVFTNIDPLTDDYHQLAKKTIEKATAAYGTCSSEVQTVWDAWNAVNVHIERPATCPWVVNTAAYDIPNFDYHVPYINGIKVDGSTTGGLEAARYWGDWRWNSAQNQLEFYHKQFKKIDFNQNAVVSVESNEPLSSLTFDGVLSETTGIFYDAATYFPTVTYRHTQYSLFWTIDIHGSGIPTSPAGYRLVFSGTDLAGNSLIMLKDIATSPPSLILPPFVPNGSLPQRSALTNPFSPTPIGISGQDKMHLIADCSPINLEDDICDNHLPHLQELTVYYPGFDPNIYEERIDRQTWAENGSQLCFEQEIPGYYVDFSTDDDINLLVKASEPLSALQLQRISLGGIVYEISASSSPLSLNSVTPNAEQTEWVFTLHYDDTPIYSNIYLTTDGVGDNLNAYRLHFVGHDLAGNPLQVVENMNTYDAAVLCLDDIGELPHRTATGEWSARYDGADQAFRFNIDFCEELWFSAPNFPAFLNIIPDGNTEPAPVSYSILDNTTGTFAIENVPIIDPADDTYNANGDICATLGSLPDSYTVFVTYPGACQKALSGNIAPPPCTFESHTVGYSTQVVEGGYTIVSSRLWLPLDAEYPCTVNISGGSIDSNSGYGGTPITLTSAGGSTHEIIYRVLTAELNYDFPYYVTDANGCISKGLLRPYHISPVVYDPSFDHTKPNNSDICARATACFDYTFESQEPAVPMYCSLPDAVVSVISDELQGDGQTYRQIGRVCYTDQGEQVGTAQEFALIAQPLSGLGDTVAYSVSIISDLEVATSVQHARSVCGDDNCAGVLSVSASAGSGDYEYEWDNGATTATLSDLCGGTYSVTVSDIETGCATTATGQVGIIVTSGNTEVVTYAAAAELIKPDIRLAPALFDSQTKVEYTLPEDGFVTIKVYNLQGILVETLLSNEYRTAGNYQINDEGGEYANGLYLFS
ncbi:MAG: M4 family metallopeptidase, partial [Chitinophagales bacterium]|nr:M4 family metallopeptidase [Chitinophagales bacterium]